MTDVDMGMFSPARTDVDMLDLESEYSHASGTSRDTNRSSLLRLPPELRQRIWFFCLHNNENPISWPSKTKSGQGLATALLRTCHAIYDEAAPMLYEANVLTFRHPSDANMFLYAHNVALGKQTRRLLVHILDRDLPLWMGYFSSNNPVRSLTHDYPALQQLFVVLRSSPMLSQTGPDLLHAYRRWHASSSLQNLCGSLKMVVEGGLSLRIIFARLASFPECQQLLDTFSEEFDVHPRDAPGPRLRTKWIKTFGAHIALDGTDAHNPWRTGNLF